MLKISIITASYNYEDFIKETIESILAQTHEDWELIIVDDGSADNSIEVIKSYVKCDGRISLLTHDNNQNLGLIEAVKLGLSQAAGDYIAFLESDDIWESNYLEEKIKVIKGHPDAGFIFNSVEMFGDEKTMKEYDKYFDFSKKILRKITFPQNIFNLMLLSNFVPTFSCVMVKKEAILECNFDMVFAPWLDWGLWLQIAYRYDFYYLPNNLTKWRMHQKSYINRAKKKTKNNGIIKSFVGNIFAAEPNPIKRFTLTYYYTFVMILFKINRSLIKKLLLAL